MKRASRGTMASLSAISMMMLGCRGVSLRRPGDDRTAAALAELTENCYLRKMHSNARMASDSQNMPMGETCVDFEAYNSIERTGTGLPIENGHSAFNSLYVPPNSMVSAWDPTFPLKWKADAAFLFDQLNLRLRDDAECDRENGRVHMDFLNQSGIGEMMMSHAFCVGEIVNSGQPIDVPVPNIEWAKIDTSLAGCNSSFGCFFQKLQPPVCDNSGRREQRPNQDTSTMVSGSERNTSSLLDVQSHGQRQVAEEFEYKWGSMLYASALLSWWWRPQEELQHKLMNDARRLGLDTRTDCIAMHVRHSDSCSNGWRQCESFNNYMEAAATMRAEYGFKRIYLATDSPAIIAQSKNYTDWDFVSQSMDRAKYTATSKWHETHMQDFGHSSFYEALLDIYAGSRCRAFVGSFDASLSHMIFSLMTFREGMIVPYASVGGRHWCRKNRWTSCCRSGLSGGDSFCRDYKHHAQIGPSRHDCNTR